MPTNQTAVDATGETGRPDLAHRLLARANALDDWAIRRGAIPASVGPRVSVRQVARECVRPPFAWVIFFGWAVILVLAVLGARGIDVVFGIYSVNALAAARERARRRVRPSPPSVDEQVG